MRLVLLLLCLTSCARGPWTQGVAHDRPFALARGTVALWVWDTEPLLSQPAAADAFFSFVSIHGINRVFLQLPRSTADNRIDLRPFARLLARLTRQGVAGEALDGAPTFVDRENHPLVLARVEAVLAYNQRAAAGEQFHGFRLDIEPHAHPRFGAERARLLRDYLLLLELVRARLGQSALPFGVDMPFWFDRGLGDAVLERADNVAILAYRTQVYYQNGILDLVRPLLGRAAALRRDIYVAIDTTDSGEPGSFHDQSERALIDVIGELDRALRNQRPYKGVAIHSYESLRDLHR